MKLDITTAKAEAEQIRRTRYPESSAVFLCGSIVRGEATRTSDLDLVVIFPRVKSAFRESFRSIQRPVESFVHDLQTLKYFFEKVDRPSAIPTLATMIAEGVQVPTASKAGEEAKHLAIKFIEKGPKRWTAADRDNSRYMLTNLLDDLRAPRSTAESLATLSVLYGALAHHFLRSRNKWSAKGKAIPRALNSYDPMYAKAHTHAFHEAFRHADTAAVERLALETLEPDGGELFENYRREAPEDWRLDE